MAEQDDGIVNTATTPQRPTTNDPVAWKTYWEAQGQTRRTEPEISTERQKFLKERLSIIPNLKQGIYPFKGIKLHRADVEWLIDMHDGGQSEHNAANVLSYATKKNSANISSQASLTSLRVMVIAQAAAFYGI